MSVNLRIPKKERMGLLGRNGTGKSTLLRLIGGSIQPNSGRVVRSCSVSWPVGLTGTFHQDLTGRQNVRFFASVYRVDLKALCNFVLEFSELQDYFDQKVRAYSSGMRARLAFSISMGIRFDLYLIDEVTAVGDEPFRRKSEQLLLSRLSDSGAIIVSHSVSQIKRLCVSGAVMEHGRLRYFEDVDRAIEYYQTHCSEIETAVSTKQRVRFTNSSTF